MTGDESAESPTQTRSNTKYGDQIEDHDWSTPDRGVEEPERTFIDDHEAEVVYVTDPSEDMGYGREKYTAVLRYDDDGTPYVLYAIEHRWKGNYWRDTTDWNWSEVPEPVRRQVAAVLPVDSPDALDPAVQVMDEGGESRWEKIHKPRMGGWECELEMPRTEMKAHLQWDHNRDKSEAEAMITASTEGSE